MMTLKPWILKLSEAAGNKIFESGDFDLNIIGLRRADGQPDSFDDQLFVCYKSNGLWQMESFKITTDPGVYHLTNPGRVEGTAILKAGQYLGEYRLAHPRGKYPALCQRLGPVTVWRDDNRDEFLDYNQTQTGMFGINIHRAHSVKELESVGRYSAGCQVFSRSKDLDRLLCLCKMQIKEHPSWNQSFSYTLLEGKEYKKPTKKRKKKATK